MRIATVRVAPDPHVEAGGRDAAGAEPQDVGALAAERVLDVDLVGMDERVGAADPDVAAAIDDEARVAAQAGGDHVGGEALAGAAGVEAQAGRPDDLPRLVVDLEAAPALLRPRARRPPRRRVGERLGQRHARDPGPGGDVAGGLDLADQGRVDETAAALGGDDARRDRAPQQLRGGHALAPIGVQPAELALGLEAGERRVEVDDEASRLLGRVRGRRHPRPGLADQQPHVAAHRVEGEVVFAHEELVTTGSAPEEKEELLTGLVLTVFSPGVGTIVVTTRRLTTLRTCTTWRGRGRLFGREAVGEEGEEHREEDDRAPEDDARGRPLGAAPLSHRRPRSRARPRRRRRRLPAPPPLPLEPVDTGAVAPPLLPALPLAVVETGAGWLPLPEPALEPLVWVVTGELPEPPLPWCEPPPLVWVVTGALPEPELSEDEEAPLLEVVTGVEE